jgi:hypothetical protein
VLLKATGVVGRSVDGEVGRRGRPRSDRRASVLEPTVLLKVIDYLLLLCASCPCLLQLVPDAGAAGSFFFEVHVLKAECYVGIHVEFAAFASK